MNITVLHGDDIKQSYTCLKAIISQAKNRGFRGEYILPNQGRSLSESLVSRSIFNEKVIYVVENINQFSNNDLKWLKGNVSGMEADLVVYHQGLLPQSILKVLPKEAKVEEFKLPNFLWKFLDSFYPGNSKNCIKLLHKVAEADNLERVFALLARHIKNLYMVRLDKNSLAFPSWRVDRLIYQSSKYKDGKIEKIISEMAKIDIDVKTSNSNLLDALDFLISTQLE